MRTGARLGRSVDRPTLLKPRTESSAVNESAPPSTRVERTFTSVRDDIVSGELEPGTRLAIEHLRRRYDVGSSTLREALSLLISEALVTSEGQRGFRVAEVSLDDLQDLSQMRVLVETHALRESIANGDDAWEASIVAAHHRLNKAQDRLDAREDGSPSEWELRNRELHEALVAGCDSRWTHHMLRILHRHSERYRRITMTTDSVPRDIRTEHQELVDAVLAHDADRATNLLESHILRTADALVSIIDSGSETAS